MSADRNGGDELSPDLRDELRKFYAAIGQPSYSTLTTYHGLKVPKQTFSDQGLTGNDPKGHVPQWSTVRKILESWWAFAEKKQVTLARDEWRNEEWWRSLHDTAVTSRSSRRQNGMTGQSGPPVTAAAGRPLADFAEPAARSTLRYIGRSSR